MYPATIFNWHDNSAITEENQTVVIDDSPLFMQVFSADKGTEDLVEISGPDFDAMYGTMSFDRHGQSAIQAKNIIDAGGRLFAKRVVAPDSTLANVVLSANVSEDSTTGGVKVKWTAESISGCKNFAEVKKAALELLDVSAGKYPLIIYADNGRGVSGKSVRLTPDYATSKTIGKTFYTLTVYEGTSVTESTTISFDPTVIYASNAYRLDEYATTQITGVVDDNIFELYVEAIADHIVDIDVATLRTYDLVYGYTNRGSSIDKFTLDDESVDLDAVTGVEMKEGTNGAFGDAPVNTSAWEQAICDVFSGAFSTEIYDVDQHKIAAICDANYPRSVKKEIFKLVNFREDMVYFRDFGVGLNTFLAIKGAYNQFAESVDLENGKSFATERSCFVADYSTSYQIKDPNTHRNIEVTMMYDFAACLVSHIANNPYAPLAGTANGFILENAIKGTVNFVPVNTPAVNQKDAMDEIKVNYAIFEDDACVVQTTYTSQEEYTQLSFANNVIGIQRVLRAVRTACPKQRYSLSTGKDLQTYATAVNNVLANYVTNFDVLNFVYTEDKLKVSQKIFYASIEFAFQNWAQTEIFDVYAINN